MLLHVTTQKGKGYPPAEKNPVYFHGCGCFEIETGTCIDPANSVPTYTQVFGQALIELAEKDERVVAVTAAMPEGTGLANFAEIYPDRFFDVGVAEANMMSISAGLANEGMVPFCATFTPFATRRAYDQITISIAYAENPVKIVGTAPGVTTAKNGATHMCFQDLAIMRAMPNMRVYCPADVYELRSMLRYMAASKKPEYMQLIREVKPPIFDESYEFDPYRARVLDQGSDVTE